MQIVFKKIEELTPYANNARTHSSAQVDEIVRSMREFGWTNPVLLDENGTIIAGHGRVLAATRIYARGETILDAERNAVPEGCAPCIVLSGLTDAQRRAYILADNKLALNAGWDEELLRMELQTLHDFDFDLSLLGFDFDELDKLLPGRLGLTDPDEIPSVDDTNPVSQLGDIWLLGRHRIMCGDCTVPEMVRVLLDERCPKLMVTDPPYGVNYDASWRMKAGIGTKTSAHGRVLNDDRADWADAWALFPGDVAYVWHAGNKTHVVAESLERCGFCLRSQIIWAKNNLVIGRGDYHPQHEPCWYAVRKGKAGSFRGGRKQRTLWKQAKELLREDEIVFVRLEDAVVFAISGDESTIWDIPKPKKSETGHSTQKPVECMARPIRNNSTQGEIVYDPFCGSGTTIIAAEQTGRICYTMELNPLYVDIAVLRWQQFTGEKAVHHRTGAQFPTPVRPD